MPPRAILIYGLLASALAGCGGGGGGYDPIRCFLTGKDCPSQSPTPTDTTPPTTPDSLFARAVSAAQIDLTWNPATDNSGVRYYNLYRNGQFLQSTFDLWMSDIGLDASTQYCYTVTALDSARNESAQSSVVCATTQKDTVPPTAPGAPTVSSTSIADISIAWSAATDDYSVKGYKVYRNGAFKEDVSTNSFTDNDVSPNTDYCYQFSAFDSAGNESARSLQVCTSTAWTPTVDVLGADVGTAGAYGPTSLALDSSGKAHIAYTDSTTQTLRYASNADGAWNPKAIDTNVAGYAAIALDAAGNVYISYCATGVYSLKYATNVSGQWTITTVDSNWVGLFTDIVVDANGKAHISYYDYQNGDLKYATNASGAWLSETIDSAYYVGRYTSIALDSAGKAHIAYLDSQNDDLKYATNESGAWVTSTIDSGAAATWGTSIGVDSMNKVHIAYYDASDRSLKYASNSGGTWVTSTIDGNGTGAFPSLAVDADDSVHMSYNDWGSAGLRYATDSSGSWDINILVPSSAGFSSIVIDGDSRAHLSWYEANEIKYGIYSVH